MLKHGSERQDSSQETFDPDSLLKRSCLFAYRRSALINEIAKEYLFDSSIRSRQLKEPEIKRGGLQCRFEACDSSREDPYFSGLIRRNFLSIYRRSALVTEIAKDYSSDYNLPIRL